MYTISTIAFISISPPLHGDTPEITIPGLIGSTPFHASVRGRIPLFSQGTFRCILSGDTPEIRISGLVGTTLLHAPICRGIHYFGGGALFSSSGFARD